MNQIDAPTALAVDSTVVADPNQIFTDLAGEAAILNLHTGVYYGLDAVGTRIWNLLQQPRTVGAIREDLLQEYDVPADRCEHDLVRLLQELANAGLIQVCHEAAV